MKKIYFFLIILCSFHFLGAQEKVKYDTGEFLIPEKSESFQLKSAEVSLPSPSSTISTTFAGGNGYVDGHMFDITTKDNSLIIEAFDCHFYSSGMNFTMDVYVKTGTYQGNITNSSAWTKVASGTGTTAGYWNPTHVDISDFELPANTLTGIYIDTDLDGGGTGFIYTNGNAAYSNGDLQLDLGISLWGNWASYTYFSPRIWNGTIYYSYACVGRNVKAMALQSATDPYGTWTPVKGDLAPGFNMECAAKAPNYFFDISQMSVDVPIKPDYLNPFYLHGTYPSAFWAYWNNKGVNSSAVSGWQKNMWDILNGLQPIFYVYLQNGDHRLIDGLTLMGQYQMKTPFHFPGDMPADEYLFKGSLMGGDEEDLCTTTIKLKLGDDQPPVITNCGNYFELPLVRSVVRTRYGIGIDYVATLSQAALTGLVTDNCGIKSITASKTRFTRMDVGENEVWLTAVDYAGNLKECLVYVYVYMPGTSTRSGEIGNEQIAATVGAEELNLQLYPNPTTGKVNLYLSNLNNPEVSVKLFNATGGMVFDRMITTDGPVELDLTGKVSGIYLLKVNADGKEFNERIVLK